MPDRAPVRRSRGETAGVSREYSPCSAASLHLSDQSHAAIGLLGRPTANPNGLCLNSAATPAVDGNAVKLSQCGPLLDRPVVPYTQQWSYNDNGQYQAAQSNSATTGTLPNLCLNVLSQAANQAVSSGPAAPSWVPSPSVGPGAAAPPQLVNFSEFGRCLDVTARTSSRTFLIDYPCKQNPYPGAKTWNQLFQAPAIATGQASATGQIYDLHRTELLPHKSRHKRKLGHAANLRRRQCPAILDHLRWGQLAELLDQIHDRLRVTVPRAGSAGRLASSCGRPSMWKPAPAPGAEVERRSQCPRLGREEHP